MAHPAALSGLRIAGETCIDCEGCTGACIAMGEAGLTVGEIARLVLAGEHDDRVLAAVSRCGLCGLCSVHCPVDLDTSRVMGRARHVLTDCGGSRTRAPSVCTWTASSDLHRVSQRLRHLL